MYVVDNLRDQMVDFWFVQIDQNDDKLDILTIGVILTIGDILTVGVIFEVDFVSKVTINFIGELRYGVKVLP